MKLFAHLAFFGILASAATAAPKEETFSLKTRTGKSYESCRVLKVYPDGVAFAHSNGVAKIQFTDLGREQQQRFGYDAEKAAAFAAREREQRVVVEAEAEKRRQTEWAHNEARARWGTQGAIAAEERLYGQIASENSRVTGQGINVQLENPRDLGTPVSYVDRNGTQTTRIYSGQTYIHPSLISNYGTSGYPYGYVYGRGYGYGYGGQPGCGRPPGCPEPPRWQPNPRQVGGRTTGTGIIVQTPSLRPAPVPRTPSFGGGNSTIIQVPSR